VSQKFFVCCVVLAAGVLAAGCAMKGAWVWCALIITLGLVWLYAQRLEWSGIGTFGLVFFVMTAARETFMDMKPGWLLVSVIATLMAWDLDYFLHRLRQAGRVEKQAELELNHLKRILTVAGLGLLFGGAALIVKLKFHLIWILLLGAVSLYCLYKLIDLLNSERG